MKSAILTSIVSFLALCSFGQSIRFSRHYDVNNGLGNLVHVTEMDSGNIFAFGSSLNLNNTYSHYDIHHLLTDESGNVIFSNEYSIPDVSQNVRGLVKSRYTGTIYTSGSWCDYRVEAPTYCDFYFSKLDVNGDTVFQIVYPRVDTCELVTGMVETVPNRLIIAGYTSSDTTCSQRDVMFLTVDTLGTVINRVIYGGIDDDYVFSGATIDTMGNVLWTGFTKSFPNQNSGRTWVLKTDSIGNVMWYEKYLPPWSIGSSAARIVQLSDGNCVVIGGNSSFGVSSYGGDGGLLKIDTAGNVIWKHEYPVIGGQGLWGLGETEDGDLISCGVTDNPNSSDDSQAGWIIKTNSIGDTLWTRSYNIHGGVDYLYNMTILSNGDIVAVGQGRNDSIPTTQDGWLIRVDQYGCLIENCHTVDIEEVIEDVENAVFVYPNPASYILNISTSKQVQIELIRVIDLHGRIIIDRSATSTIDVGHLADGMYLLQIQTKNGNSYNERIVVEH